MANACFGAFYYWFCPIYWSQPTNTATSSNSMQGIIDHNGAKKVSNSDAGLHDQVICLCSDTRYKSISFDTIMIHCFNNFCFLFTHQIMNFLRAQNSSTTGVTVATLVQYITGYSEQQIQ